MSCVSTIKTRAEVNGTPTMPPSCDSDSRSADSDVRHDDPGATT